MEVREITFKIRDLREAGQNFVLNAVGKIGVVGIAAQILERQHRDRFCRRRGDGFLFGSHQLKNQQCRRDQPDDQDEGGELSPAPLRNMLVRRDIFRALHPVRRHLESPGDDKRDWKSEQRQHDHRGCDAVRQVQCRDHGRRDLHDQPADHAVADRDLVDIAPFQFGKEFSGIHRLVVNRDRFRSFNQRFKARILAERIPFPAQAQMRERDALSSRSRQQMGE